MRLLFIGATKFGYQCLKLAMAAEGIEIAGIITAPERFSISYSGKEKVHNVLHHDFAQLCSSSIPCHTLYTTMGDTEVVDFVQANRPDFILVVGWYHMIPKLIREIPRLGTAGIHASLLPSYSGGAPLVWSIINGEKETGVTLFYLDCGVDDGDIIAQQKVPILLNDTIATLYARIEAISLQILAEMLPRIARDEAPRVPQEHSRRSVFPQRSPQDGEIDWQRSPLELYNFVRAQTLPYPGAFTHHRGSRLTIWSASLFNYMPVKGEPGEILAVVDQGPLTGIIVATGNYDHPLLITLLEKESGTPLTGVEYAQIENIVVGKDFLGAS